MTTILVADARGRVIEERMVPMRPLTLEELEDRRRLLDGEFAEPPTTHAVAAAGVVYHEGSWGVRIISSWGDPEVAWGLQPEATEAQKKSSLGEDY